jgi:ribosome-associated translation inhibitor RaiA
MQVQVHTDNHVNGSAGLTAHVESVVTDAMQRFGHRVTRVEVHLGDENSHKKSDNDKRCSMEARPSGMAPIAVTSMASTINEAIDAATDKLVKSLQKTFDKKFDAKGRPSAAEFAAAPQAADDDLPTLDE